METNDITDTEYKPRDYTLERWMVLLLSLLFFLPFVAQGQETTTLDKNDRAGLLLKTSTPGVYVVSPAVKSETVMLTSGFTARQHRQRAVDERADAAGAGREREHRQAVGAREDRVADGSSAPRRRRSD